MNSSRAIEIWGSLGDDVDRKLARVWRVKTDWETIIRGRQEKRIIMIRIIKKHSL